MGGNVHTIQKNTEPFVVVVKRIALEVNADKITWSCLENRMQNEVEFKIDNGSFGSMLVYKYLETI